MKFLLLILCIFLFPSYSFSQDWFFGGNIFANHRRAEHRPQEHEGLLNNTIRTHVIFSPIIGYNINRFDFGISPRITYERDWQSDFGAREVIGFGLGLFSRYNFISMGNLSVLGRLNIDYVYNFHVDRNVFNSHRVNVGVGPVFEYRSMERLSINTNFGIGGISYSYNYMPNFSDTTHDFRFNFQSFFSLTDFLIGFHIHF